MSKKTRTQTNGKIVSWLDSCDLWEQYFGEGGSGVWSAKNIKRAKELCPDADILLDVGGNIGQSAIYYADWAQEVWSFEPLPHLYELLVENVQQNNLTNVKTFNNAVGDVITTLKMRAVTNNDGASFVTDKGKNLVSVDAITLDTLVIPEGRKVSYIKMDIEGYEPLALKGALNLIQKHKPIIQLEVCDGHLSRVNSNSVDLVKFVESLGYTAQLCNGKKINSATETKRDWKGDIYFLPV
jgi:FkbM family methyltransferase